MSILGKSNSNTGNSTNNCECLNTKNCSAPVLQTTVKTSLTKAINQRVKNTYTVFGLSSIKEYSSQKCSQVWHRL